MTVLLVALGAALGAPARYLSDWAVQRRHDSLFPWGTFAVNTAASLVLGVLVGAAAPGRVVALVGTGFCGSLSTFSTFAYETQRLAEDRAGLYAVGNVVASVLACAGAAALGWAVGAAG